MKKWTWLLVLPWAVIDSSYTFTCTPIAGTKYFDCPTEHTYHLSHNGKILFEPHFDEKGEAQDMAEALNAAHERRNKPKPINIRGRMVPPCEDLDPSEYKNGCYANYEFKP